jgi:PhnB protein
MAVRPIPDGYHSVTPYLVVNGVAKLIDFLQQAFGAQEMERMETPDGTVMHGEVKIGDSMIMMGEASARHKPMPASLYLYVTDTDALYQQAMQSGAISLMPPANQFYGDRNAGVQDPCGNQWWIGTHVEDVAPEEMKRRSETYLKQSRSA